MDEQLTLESATLEKNKFLGRTYGWMAIAMLISAASAFIGAFFEPFMLFIWGYNFSTGTVGRPIGFIVLSVVELGLVITMGSKIRQLSLNAVIGIFIAYSIINGLTLSSIFYIYSLSSIAYCFIATAIMFAIMSIYGMKTKRNLNTVGKYLLMALMGLIIVSLINLLVSFISGMYLTKLDWLISVATIVVFSGLTAYDSQKIIRTAEHADERVDFKKLSVYGALELYLDFINIFLRLLRLFGKKR